MLLPHPAVLKNLIEQDGAHRALSAENGSAGTQQQVEDVTYPLSVPPGTHDVGAAVSQRPGVRPQDVPMPDLAMRAEARSGFGRTRTATAPFISAG